MIKWVQVAALMQSAEDFEAMVRLVETLGIRKSTFGENRNALFAQFLPSELKLDLVFDKKARESEAFWLAVSDPDAAFDLLEKQGFEIVDDSSGPEPAHMARTFVVRLPGGTRVRVLGLRVMEEPEGEAATEGDLRGNGKRFAIVVSRFNSFITERLLAGAIDGLVRCGVERQGGYEIVRVPGAFEIPSAARSLAQTDKYDAILAIGCLLRGDTAHYDVIVNEVTRGIGQSAQETGIPHAFGVLTCDTLEQAIDRAGLKMGNKGFEAALAAVEMARLGEQVKAGGQKKPARSAQGTGRRVNGKAKKRVTLQAASKKNKGKRR